MGSLNDYRQYRAQEGPSRSGLLRRVIRQSLLALAFFLLVAAAINADNPLGAGARYVAQQGVAAESSWVDFQGAVAVSANAAETPAAPATPPEGDAAGDQPPRFTAPASGIVVTELAVAAGGFSTQQGILIQGNPGQSVKAAAQGEVGYLGENEDGFLVELRHSGGFTSLYQGMSSLEVAAGDQVDIGQVIGLTASGELTFSLLLDDEEVSPLEYLFQ